MSTEGDQIRQATVVVRLEKHGFGNSRKLDSQAITAVAEGQADPDAAKAQKVLLKSPKLEAITALDAKTADWVRDLATPVSFLSSGHYLIPLRLLDRVAVYLDQYKRDRQRLVDDFMVEYENVVEEARTRLGPLFNSGDYPPADKVRSKFSAFWQPLEFDAPKNLERFSAERYAEARVQFQAQWSSAWQEAYDALRLGFAGLVVGIHEKLQPAADGRRKKIYKADLEKFNHFLDTFSARNLTADGQLEALVQEARDLLNGVTTEDLRKNDTTREILGDAFSAIRADLEAAGVVVQPKRRITVLAPRADTAPIVIDGIPPEALAEQREREQAARQVMLEARFVPPPQQ